MSSTQILTASATDSEMNRVAPLLIEGSGVFGDKIEVETFFESNDAEVRLLDFGCEEGTW